MPTDDMSITESSGEAITTVSIVIPVYNSAGVVGQTIDEVLRVFTELPWALELILVNDGSTDDSWSVIERYASDQPAVVAVDLLQNYGQHNANLCGIRMATGDVLVTMDDDLQNPPSEIAKLVEKSLEGFDAVFGRFDTKKASLVRTRGTKLVDRMNRSVFGKDPDLVVSNFRALHRSVYLRIAASQSVFPYITGQALMYSGRATNVTVRHDPRKVGTSTYSPLRILRLVVRILFSYSSAPIRLVGAIGSIIAIGSMTVGVTLAVRSLIVGESVAGWTSTIVLLSFLNGVVILMLGMLGEYLIRTLQQVSDLNPYFIRTVVGTEGDD